MLEQLFNPYIMSYVKVFALSIVSIMVFVILCKTINNLIFNKKDQIIPDIKHTVKVFGVAGIMALGLFMFMGSLFLI